jgi:hypothetical protein
MNTDAATYPIGFGLIGVLLAFIVNYLYTNEIWLDAFIEAPVTVTEVMTVIILFWLIIGVVLGVSKR